MITEQQLFEFITNTQNIGDVPLTLTTTLDSLGIDSLAKMELVFQLEDQYKITVPTDDLDVATLQDVLDLVNKYTP
jgi:acyl carrier protein